MAANSSESVFDVTHVYCDPPLSTATVVSSALSLMVALAWNGAAKDLVDIIAPKFDGLKAKFIGAAIYATLMTVIVVMVIVVYNQVHRQITRREVIREKMTTQRRPGTSSNVEPMITGIGDVAAGGGGRVVPEEYAFPYGV